MKVSTNKTHLQWKWRMISTEFTDRDSVVLKDKFTKQNYYHSCICEIRNNTNDSIYIKIYANTHKRIQIYFQTLFATNSYF